MTCGRQMFMVFSISFPFTFNWHKQQLQQQTPAEGTRLFTLETLPV